MAPAMPCKNLQKNCGSGASNKFRTRRACILDNLVDKFIPMPQAMKIPAAKAAVDKEWKNGENFGVEPDKSQK